MRYHFDRVVTVTFSNEGQFFMPGKFPCASRSHAVTMPSLRWLVTLMKVNA